MKTSQEILRLLQEAARFGTSPKDVEQLSIAIITETQREAISEMTNTPNDGGPAFPWPVPTFDTSGRKIGHSTEQSGMSMRDYFAAAALQSFISGLNNNEDWDAATAENASEWAYDLADAMIKKRAKPATS